MAFRILPLDPALFEPLFYLPAHQLALHHAQRVIATHKPGFPCRVSLADAEVGEEVLLLNFEHQPSLTPFRSRHAIYVRRDAEVARLAPDAVPPFLNSRVLSLRAFTVDGMLVAAEVVPGSDLETAITRLLATPGTAYLHLHTAAMGCYLARAEPA